MQPYLFPYIGYFQLINAVDRFVIYDDVNYIMRGYINRNEILLFGKRHRFTLKLEKASSNKLINKVNIFDDGNNKERIIAQLQNAYKKAPMYPKVFHMLRGIIMNKEVNLSKYVSNTIMRLSEYLGIDTQFLYSSEIEKNNELRGQEKVIEICKKLNARQCVNPIGGLELYDRNKFKEQGIDLSFLKPRMEDIRYEQFIDDFEGKLSIIDMLMFSEIKRVQDFLYCYDLA